jgi:hypothetical protein
MSKKFEFSVLEYLGKVDDGVLVLLSVIHENKYYESTFFYDNTNILLTIPEDLEKIVGDIKLHPDYMNCLTDILKRVIPYNEIFDRIDPVNFSRWVEIEIEQPEEVERVNPSDFKILE